MNDLELIKVKAFYYAKVVEFGGDFEKANKCIGVLDDKYQNLRHKRELRFDPGLGYRIKPETVIHPGGEMPKPISLGEAEKASFVYLAKLNSDGLYADSRKDMIVKQDYAKLGHAYATKQDAIDAGHIMFNIPKGE